MPTRVPSSDKSADVSPAHSSDSEVLTIRELIDRMARTEAESPFLISPETGRVLTFQGLQEQSALLSSQLREAGLERGDKVAFLLENGLFTAQLFLGAMYGGFVSVPLNVRAGVAQLSYMLDHCDAKVVYVADEYRALMAEVMALVPRTVQVIPADVDGFCAARETPLPAASLPVPAPEDEALLMYTSGSTGNPKGVVHSHRTMLAGAGNVISAEQLTGADRSLLLIPLYHHNASCVTLVPTLATGGSVVVPHRFSISQFWDWMDEHRCTWSALVPTIVAQLLDWQDPRAGNREAAFQRIRFLRSSSGPLAPSMHREFLAKFNLLLKQAMGTTEAGVVFSNPLPPGENKIGSPGLPWGFEVKIVDQEGAPVAARESGEIVIRGPAIMPGYYKEPEQTATVLGADGWLRTGDLAYRDADGYVFVVGRSKELIIKGGVNIAPREIDEVLESHPAVREAAAIGVPDHYLGEDLIAFVVLRSGVASDERELLAYCESRLGHFKTPTRIYFARDLPKGPSGKVQRLRLRDEAAELATAGSASSRGEFGIAHGPGEVAGLPAAASSLEQIIADTWTEVLSLTPVDADSNFFALGGHSLLAMRCVSLLRERIPVALSLSDFFENATVAQQAALVRRRGHPDAGQALMGGSAAARQEALPAKVAPSLGPPAIPPRDPKLPCPLSIAQRRLWFIEQLNPGLPVYNEAEAGRLLGELNAEALERALNVIVERHEALRTTIQTAHSEPLAVVHESWPLELKQIDLSALDPAERQAEVERLLIDEPRRPYHFETEPGIRATLLRLAPREHVFILMMHHIFCDRSSLGVLWRELAALYRAFCRGESLVLPPLPIQYGDYAVWQQPRITETALADDLSFWTEKLRGAPVLLELPTDRPRPITLSYRGAKRRFRLNPILTQALRDFSQQEKTSLYTLLTAALDTLLYRYTGAEDILLGIPMADRERPELQSVIGLLVHTCVLRTGLWGDMTFRELLARVQKGMLEFYRHRAVPFEELVRKLQPERSQSYSPLFQVMMNWRDRGLQLSFVGLDGLEVEPLLAESRASKLDMTLSITDAGDEIWLEVEYSTDLFDEARIERMVGHYQTLLEGIVARPDDRLSALPLLTSAERHQILVEWNRTEADYPGDATIHELFEAQAARTPDATAIISKSGRVSYRDLNRRANQLARYLRPQGVGPGALVGVCLDLSPEAVVALVGSLKAGAAFVPLDPGYPPERLAFMIADARIPLVISKRKWLPLVGGKGTPVVCLDTDHRWIEAQGEDSLPRVTGPASAVYVLYTSGSSGVPKGVLGLHRGAVNRFAWMWKNFPFSPGEVCCLKTSLNFVDSIWEVFGPLLAGVPSVIISDQTVHDPAELLRALASHAVTRIVTVPSLLRVILDRYPDLGDRLPRLKLWVSSGEALSADLARRFYAAMPNATLLNLYGSTEVAADSTAHVARPAADDQGAVPLGRPIDNTQCYVLDAQLQPVPIGVRGDLYVGGVGLARGYYNRPELTAACFITDPFATQAEARLYKTGDQARYLPDGTLQFLGRADQQVKIRGFRVEIGEIESILAQHPAVRAAAVALREENPDDKRLVAYIVPREAANPPTPKTLRDFLKDKLPDYMLPSDILTLDALPLTPSGKLDRRALPIIAALPRSVAPHIPPRDAQQASLVKIWEELLNVRPIGIEDDFFDLGGHSLLAMRLMDRIEDAYGQRLPLATLFAKATIKHLAECLHTESLREGQPAIVPVQPVGSQTPFFFLNGDWWGGLYCRKLASMLGPEQPFYGVMPNGFDGKPLLPSVEAMAEANVKQVVALQPQGPYLLGGYCNGGLVAYEMAQQMTQRGLEVGLVVLLDAGCPRNFGWLKALVHGACVPARLGADTEARIYSQLRNYMVRMDSTYRRGLRALLTLYLQAARRNLLRFAGTPPEKLGMPLPEFDDPGQMRRYQQFRRIISFYRPKPYPGRAVLLRTQSLEENHPADRTGGWGKLASQLEIHELPGDHLSILTDHLGVVAGHMGECLAAFHADAQRALAQS